MMATNEINIPPLEDQTPLVSPGNYSPVTVYIKDTLGAHPFRNIVGWMDAR